VKLSAAGGWRSGGEAPSSLRQGGLGRSPQNWAIFAIFQLNNAFLCIFWQNSYFKTHQLKAV